MQSTDNGILASFDSEAHSFVVRLWAESKDDVSSTTAWRGWIEHVQNGQRHYFQEVDEISQIVAGHLSHSLGI